MANRGRASKNQTCWPMPVAWPAMTTDGERDCTADHWTDPARGGLHAGGRDLRPGLRVLEIGAGTGSNAALIAAITGTDVVTVDVSDVIVAEATAALQRADITNAAAHVADGYLGFPDGGPYDRLIVTCGVAGVSPHWLEQLAPGGLIVHA